MYDSSRQRKSMNTLLLGMYHRKTLDKHKERVLADLTKPKGSCRVVVATTSLAMGVEIPDLRCVIQYGCPLDVEDYIQRIGRVGRGKKPREALLLFSSHQVGKASPEMKLYAKTTNQCLRKALYGNFVHHDIKMPSLEHSCCSSCHSKCRCKEGGEECNVEKPLYEQKPTKLRHMK